MHCFERFNIKCVLVDDVQFQIEYELQPTSTGVCITCTFLNSFVAQMNRTQLLLVRILTQPTHGTCCMHSLYTIRYHSQDLTVHASVSRRWRTSNSYIIFNV